MHLNPKQLLQTRRTPLLVAAALVLCGSAMFAQEVFKQQPGPLGPPSKEPPVITPGKSCGEPPSDAVVIFDGKSLDNFVSDRDGTSPAQWDIVDGAMQVKAGAGGIRTKQKFGDCQLHIEWATPAEVKGEGQGRGNSGIFLSERYEVQVLDSYNNKTYANGQAGALYKQHAPLVNASRKPGEWQTYDIIYHAPAFDEDGKLLKRARITVLHNGVLIQDNVELMGFTYHDRPAAYIAHGPGSLYLQDHGNPVRFRNIWIRPL